MKERFHIFCGHFGSGKSEVALNFAMKQQKSGKKVSIVDLDIVNPYFRTNDARETLKEQGIEVIAPEYANSNLDMPTVPADIMKVFNNPDKFVVFDVGGDEDGAYALGRYLEFFKKESYRMYLVVNAKRPLTGTPDEIMEMAKEIENASRLKITDVINNTNIGNLTDENTILEGEAAIASAAANLGLEVTLYSGKEKALSKLPQKLEEKKFTIDIQIKMPWER